MPKNEEIQKEFAERQMKRGARRRTLRPCWLAEVKRNYFRDFSRRGAHNHKKGEYAYQCSDEYIEMIKAIIQKLGR
jgi:hypothetical protein